MIASAARILRLCIMAFSNHCHPPRIRTAMNRAARGGDEVPVGPDAIDPPARVVHSLGRTADDRGTADSAVHRARSGGRPAPIGRIIPVSEGGPPQNACQGDT